MSIATWLKERRLDRTHTKLKRLRKLQSRLREKIEAVEEEKKNSAPSTALETKEARLHAEKDKITQQVGELSAEEDRLKAELKADKAAA